MPDDKKHDDKPKTAAIPPETAKTVAAPYSNPVSMKPPLPAPPSATQTAWCDLATEVRKQLHERAKKIGTMHGEHLVGFVAACDAARDLDVAAHSFDADVSIETGGE